MKGAFLDTAGWFAALSPRESHHAGALAAYRGWMEREVPLITTNLVVAEMQILISRARGVGEALRFLDSLEQDPSHQVVYVDARLERTAIDRWLRRFADQRVSLTDAVSFEVMRARKLTHVLTLDAHFAHAGFTCMP
ncbi:MAG: type II toxin-antitoxin system VapC family toxin [Gemmatimonadaceae bacterium]|nr:type II toxin-antitoxin system VapC family toxin [Gemmatimonadaceae bacterium]